jgi:hypothetical protein
MYTQMNYLFDQAHIFTNEMIFLQLNFFWIILKRFFTNPIKMAADISLRQMSLFLATANEKLMYDALSEIKNVGTLSKERERFLIIKTILQEYNDIIFGSEPWLSEKNLGHDFFNHLAHPKKQEKVKRNRQRGFKNYKVIL